MKVLLTSALSMALCLAPLAAEEKDKKGDPSKTGLPIKATLKSGKDSYKLQHGSLSVADFGALLEKAKKGKAQYPPAPTADLTFELKNTSKADIQIWTSGDPVQFQMILKGPGAVHATPRVFFTQEFRLPKATTLKAGETLKMPIKALSYGHRGASRRAYWSKPGKYTLTVGLQTGMNPPPEGIKAGRNGFGKVVIESQPLELTITKD